jgi:hypothetical protein
MSRVALHTDYMNRDEYIAPIVEAYIEDGTAEEKLALTKDLWGLFDALYACAGFDSVATDMLESESPKQANSTHIL